MSWTIDNNQFPQKQIDANTPPFLSKHSFSYFFLFSNMTIPLTPAFLDNNTLPQHIDDSAPAPTLHKIKLQLKSVRIIKKIIKMVSG